MRGYGCLKLGSTNLPASLLTLRRGVLSRTTKTACIGMLLSRKCSNSSLKDHRIFSENTPFGEYVSDRKAAGKGKKISCVVGICKSPAVYISFFQMRVLYIIYCIIRICFNLALLLLLQRAASARQESPLEI